MKKEEPVETFELIAATEPPTSAAAAEKSKSQVKRELNALREQAEKFATLPKAVMAKLPFNENLMNALYEAPKITSHLARKRHIQYIAKLLRAEDPNLVQQYLAGLEPNNAQEVRRLHIVEHWRDQLLTQGDVGLTAILHELPQADRQQLRQWMRNAQQANPVRAQKAKRELFQYLRALYDEHIRGE